jgi:uncharacterized membrane protein YgcG
MDLPATDLPATDLAVKTVASTATIWVMVIVLSILTAILVSAAWVADSWQVRADRRARRLGALGFGEVGITAGGVPAQRPEESAADAPTRPDLPAVSGSGVSGGAVSGSGALPEQRGGESDRAARAATADAVPQDDDPARNR